MYIMVLHACMSIKALNFHTLNISATSVQYLDYLGIAIRTYFLPKKITIYI